MPIAVVTSGTKGIGLALVNLLSQKGFTVFTCARHIPSDDVVFKYPERVIALVTDMSKPDQVKFFADQVLTAGVPQLLVNNTGVFLPGSILDEPEGQLQQQWDTNVMSAYNLTRALVPAMRKTKHGHVFNMCSIASFTAYANGGGYAMTKFALLGFSKVLREELKAEGIRVTAVMPGATFTASWDGVDLPEDRFMPAEDVAEIIWQTYKLSDRTVVEELILRPQLGDI